MRSASRSPGHKHPNDARLRINANKTDARVRIQERRTAGPGREDARNKIPRRTDQEDARNKIPREPRLLTPAEVLTAEPQAEESEEDDTLDIFDPDLDTFF